jgi:AcrR family transcriptional regulator
MSAEDAATAAGSPGSARRAELLGLAYDYVLERGLAGLSLRPLAAATGTSPRVLLYLFDSKEGLVRDLLARAREEQVALVRADLKDTEIHDLDDVIDVVWRVLAAPERRRLVRLIYEAFIISVQPDPGPWEGFATEQVGDWLALLRAAQPEPTGQQAEDRATRALAVIRGLLLDLLATDDNDRIARALAQQRP